MRVRVFMPLPFAWVRPPTRSGAPVTETFAQEIEADAYAPDAATAVDVARGLIKSEVVKRIGEWYHRTREEL